MNRKIAKITAALWMLTISSAVVQSQEWKDHKGGEEGDYVRLTHADGEPVALETAITRFAPKSGKTGLIVDLVAAIHIGDDEYYKQLNERFEDYDVVLYELVAAPGEEIPDPKAGDNPLRAVHRLMQSTLGLSSQLDKVDYTASNFVHADMSPAQMSEALRSRGDTPVTFALAALADVLRQANIEAQKMDAQQEQPTISQQNVLSVLTGNGGTDLKKQMAVQLSRGGGSATALGPTIGQLLVEDRNAAAMKVFQRELAKGKNRIAIFYGAAHMPDFESRLRNDFGLKSLKREWVTAWDLKASSSTESPLSAFLKALQ